MAKYTKDNIEFEISSQGMIAYPTPHYNGNNDYEHAQEDGIEPFINAVEINWNNAYLPNNKININSTSELLNLIDKQNTEKVDVWEDFDE